MAAPELSDFDQVVGQFVRPTMGGGKMFPEHYSAMFYGAFETSRNFTPLNVTHKFLHSRFPLDVVNYFSNG